MNLEYYWQGKMAFYPKFASSSGKNSTGVDAKQSENDIGDIDTYIPRDAVNILNELKPGLNYTIVHYTSNDKIIGSVEVDDKTYYGNGKSDVTAKQSAAEAALRDLYFDMIFAIMTDSDDNESVYNTNSWKLLGSLAMFKLLEEWLLFYTSEKTHKTNVPNSPPKKKLPSQSSLKNGISIIEINRDSKVEKKILPADSSPCVTLSALIGVNLKFVDLKVNGDRPPYTFAITLDDTEYVGEPAANKKDAKQNVARKVLIKKYGYNFTKQK